MGRGRGFGGMDSGGFTGNFYGGRPVYYPMDEIDFEIQQRDESPRSGRNTQGGRGSSSGSNGNNTPRGRGGSAPKLPSTSSLSNLWYEERPLLRPIKFIRSVETATLFQEAEELLEPTAQSPDRTAESHVPTADKVSRVFGSTHPHLFNNTLFDIEEGIEEVNFEDLGLLHERVLGPAPALATHASPGIQKEGARRHTPKVQPKETLGRDLVTTGATIQAAPPLHKETVVVETKATIATTKPEPTPTATPSLFFVDTGPSASQTKIPVPKYEILPRTAALGENAKAEVEPDSEDDVIVYNAPKPRIFTPKVEPTPLANVPPPKESPSSTPRQINPLRRNKFVHVVGKNARRGSSGVLGVKRKRLSEHKNFAAFGAMIAEARLRKQGEGADEDPKKHMRRQGDSDLDWGDETDESEKENKPVVATAEGMDLDPDLVGSGVAVAAMERFVEGINGNQVTMDDLKDADAMGDSSSDVDDNGHGSTREDPESDEEKMSIEDLVAGEYSSDFSDEEEEDDVDPRAGFQARLDRLRKKQRKVIEMEDDEDEMDLEFQWSEGEEIDDVVEEALDKYGKNRVARNMVFRAIQDGFFDEPQPKASSSRRKDIPAELQDQWEKDRLKKAKKKREREIARLEAALDPLVTKKGGKKSKKAMIAAAKLDPSIEIPHRIVDMDTIEEQIRRFLADKGKQNMALPACDKITRKGIHNLAALFGLGSKSKDAAQGRYTTLFKKKHSGEDIDERKVARMMKGFKFRASHDVIEDVWDDMFKAKSKGKGRGKGKGKLKEKGNSGHLKTREGDVVGHAAPKIDEKNIGFMMLSSMGWSDGAAIGLSGGLDAPLTAVIKKTKLGLGASVSAKS